MFSKAQFYTAHTKEISRRGFSLVEVVIVASIFSVFMVSLVSYYKKVLDVSQDTTRHIQSGFLLEEGIEVVKMLRDESWSNKVATLSTTTTYYFLWSGSVWSATTTEQKIENVFTRSMLITDVFRDVNDTIASVGTHDPGTKKIHIDVSWPRKGGGATTTESAETYVTNLFNN